MNTIPGSGELFKQEIIKRITEHESISRIERFLIDTTTYGQEYELMIFIDSDIKYEDVHKLIKPCFAPPRYNHLYVEISCHGDGKYINGCYEFEIDGCCQYPNSCGKCKMFRATISQESEFCDVPFIQTIYLYNYDQILKNLTKRFGKNFKLKFSR